jgi:hypothetical protein
MVSVYSPPHPVLLEESHNTLYSCTPAQSIRVIDVKEILSVVAMVPHHPFPELPQRFFLVEKPGLNIHFLKLFEENLEES